MRTGSIWKTIACCAFALALPTTSAAQPGESRAAVEFYHSQQMFKDLDFDTGWVPGPNAPIRVRFDLHVGGGVESTMLGDAVLSWPSYYEYTWEGAPDGGSFIMDVGVEMEATIAWDLPWPIGSGQRPLPIVPNFDLIFEDEVFFDPYLLYDAPEESVFIEDEIDKTELAVIDLVDILSGGVPIPGLTAGLVLQAGGRYEGELTGVEIVTNTDGGDELVHDEDGQVVEWPFDGEALQQGQTTCFADATFRGGIILTPGITVKLLGVIDWTLDPVDIPIANVENTFPWRFGPESVSFEVELPPEDDPDAPWWPIDGGVDGGDGWGRSGGADSCSCDHVGAHSGSLSRALLSLLG